MSSKVEAYRTAANSLFDKWQALSMAVQHSFGGQYSTEKAEWLKTVTCDFLTNHESAPDRQDVEDFLSSLMDQEFDTIVDDGSVPEVSRQLVELWHQWKVNGELIPATQTSHTSNQIIQENKDKVETTKTVSEVENRTEDDEGWTVVSRKR